MFDRNNIGIDSFVDVSTNGQDSSGKCVFDPINLEIHPLATDQGKDAGRHAQAARLPSAAEAWPFAP